MSKEIAKKLITELQTSTELKAKIAGITDPAEMVKKAVEAGYDVTLEELTEAEKEFRAERAKKTDGAYEELSADELEAAAGGSSGAGEKSSDGKDLGCLSCDLTKNEQWERNEWCKNHYYCGGLVY